MIRQLQRSVVARRYIGVNYSRYGFNQEVENIEALEKERVKSYDGVQTITSAAVRALEFCEPENGNYLNLKVLKNLSSKLRSLETNWTANAVFVGSRSIDFFSNGIHDDDVEAEGDELFSKIQDVAAQVNDYADQKLLALYGGFITGTPFGMLMGSHVRNLFRNISNLIPTPQYRLGTPSLNLVISEPSRGQIPLGGLCFRFCLVNHGKVVARYLSLSGAMLHSVEIYELGLLTNLTDHKPHTSWQYGDTTLLNDTQAVQPPQGEPAFLPDMVESVDINSDFDVSEHVAWKHFLLADPQRPDDAELPPDHIKVIYEAAEKALDVDTLEEAVANLKQLAPTEMWARNTLKHMVTCDPLALKAIFHLTAQGDKTRRKVQSMQEIEEPVEKINDYVRTEFLATLTEELSIAKRLLEQQREAKKKNVGWFNRNVVKKSVFDLSFYEEEPIEPLDTLEPKTNKQILEEALAAEEKLRSEEEALASAVQQFDQLMGLAVWK